MVKKTKKVLILGIDPGIADTGYGLINKDTKGNLKCITYGSIKTQSKTEMTDRLFIINKELNKIIKKYRPKIIALEQLFFCKNVKTALTVGQAKGVIMFTSRQAKIPLNEFTPLQVKQAVAAYGQASKVQIQKMVKLLLNLKEIPKPDDAADALAVAICAAHSLTNN